MAFLDVLKKIALPAAAIAGAPFTGGASTGLLGFLGSAAPIAGAIGAGLTGNSQQAANNRGEKYAGQMDLAGLLAQRDMAQQGLNLQADNSLFNNTLAREQEGRVGRTDAWAQLLSAQHALNPSAPPMVSPYQGQARQPTAAEQQGAGALTNEVMARLTGGNPIAMPTRTDVSLNYDPLSTIDPKLLNAGKMETAGNWLGPILSFLGRQQDQQPPAVMSARNGVSTSMPVRY